MKDFDFAASGEKPVTRTLSGLRIGVLVMLMAGVLVGCSKEPKKPGQALVKVNGEEITAFQLNSELQFAGAQNAPQDVVRTQVLESLVDRQLILDAASRDKMDRSPEVMQAIERAKAIIIAQAYMQKRLQLVAKPNKAEVEAYFYKNSDMFLHRQQFDMRQLVFAQPNSKEIAEKVIKNANTIEEAAAWLTANNVKFGRNEVSRTSTDLSRELVDKLKAMPTGRVFLVNQDGRSALVAIAAVKDVPVDLQTAAPQIEQYLTSARNKEAAAAELARLRAAAKVEYLNNAAGIKKDVTAPGKTGETPIVEHAEVGDNSKLK